MAKIVDTETTIECYFDPASYITDRRGCLFYVINKYRDKIPDEVADEIYSMDLWDVDSLERALMMLEKHVDKTIITRPTTDEPDDP
jgi:hypothetical protein